jgi:hypothetical protein
MPFGDPFSIGQKARGLASSPGRLPMGSSGWIGNLLAGKGPRRPCGPYFISCLHSVTRFLIFKSGLGYSRLVDSKRAREIVTARTLPRTILRLLKSRRSDPNDEQREVCQLRLRATSNGFPPPRCAPNRAGPVEGTAAGYKWRS